jgi:hypothetical protein
MNNFITYNRRTTTEADILDSCHVPNAAAEIFVSCKLSKASQHLFIQGLNPMRPNCPFLSLQMAARTTHLLCLAKKLSNDMSLLN